MNSPTFGEKLRELREAKDISLRELAKRIEVSAPFLSDVELGRRFPAPDKLAALARELGIKVAELKQYDPRDEADNIKKMMFANPAAGAAFRTVASRLKDGMSPEEIVSRLSGKKAK